MNAVADLGQADLHPIEVGPRGEGGVEGVFQAAADIPGGSRFAPYHRADVGAGLGGAERG